MRQGNNFKKIDVNTILSKGKCISSQDALVDISPISWSKKTLAGTYRDNIIVKSTNEKKEK